MTECDCEILYMKFFLCHHYNILQILTFLNKPIVIVDFMYCYDKCYCRRKKRSMDTKRIQKDFWGPILVRTSPETSGFYGSLWILLEYHQPWETWRGLSREHHFRCNHLNLEEVGHVHLWRQPTIWAQVIRLCWKLDISLLPLITKVGHLELVKTGFSDIQHGGERTESRIIFCNNHRDSLFMLSI